MSSLSPQAGKLRTRDICVLALIGALIFMLKLALSAIPNVHLGAVLLIVCTVFFGWRAMYSAIVYVLLEGLTYGFSIWWISYAYIWPGFVALCVLFRRNRSAVIWAVLAGAQGLCFGALCALPYLLIGGWTMASAYWVSGIPFDLIHCASNFVLTLILYMPLFRAVKYSLHI